MGCKSVVFFRKCTKKAAFILHLKSLYLEIQNIILFPTSWKHSCEILLLLTWLMMISPLKICHLHYQLMTAISLDEVQIVFLLQRGFSWSQIKKKFKSSPNVFDSSCTKHLLHITIMNTSTLDMFYSCWISCSPQVQQWAHCITTH